MGEVVADLMPAAAAEEAGPPQQDDVADACPRTKSVLETLRRYASRLAEARAEAAACVSSSPPRQAFPWRPSQARGRDAGTWAAEDHQERDEYREDVLGEEMQSSGQSTGGASNSGLCSSGAAWVKGQELHYAEDSDGECIQLCKHCRLPLGSRLAFDEDGDSCDESAEDLLVHSECKAQRMVQGLRRKEDQRLRREAELKRERRLEFDIGWDPSVSLSSSCAARSTHGVARQGMSCLVLQGKDSVCVGRTEEPAGAVNLEYLALALRVRRLEGREPLFSLDPVDPTRLPGHEEGSMQMKRFEPEWLAGTSLGEVLFQADYHLKELSMGEYDQPVVGMKDCFHLADEIGDDKEWSAREWFVVRRAQLEISEDSVLLPAVKLGIEAREQILGPEGLEDAPITSPSHPLVRYAEAFSRNFDLIAERKSVIYHLREVAKASILAKFLMESGVKLEEHWFDPPDKPNTVCCLEVPQLWNERCSGEVQVQDGEIVQRRRKGGRGRRQVYGGVDFGVSRFRLSGPSRIAASVLAKTAPPSGGDRRLSAAPLSSASVGRVAPQPMMLPQGQRSAKPRRVPTKALTQAEMGSSVGLAQQVQQGQMLARKPIRRIAGGGQVTVSETDAEGPFLARARALPPAQRLTGLPGAAAGLEARSGRLDTDLLQRVKLGADLQGVDLSLDSFNLSAPTRVVQSVQPRLEDSSEEDGEEREDGLTLGEAFWLDLAAEGGQCCFGEEDRRLFRRVFHPRLSDRCLLEGAAFAPPSATLRYLDDLRRLVDEEDRVRTSRCELFFSLDFCESNPGPLFPLSWCPSFAVASSSPHACTKLISLGPDKWPRSCEVSRALRSAPPVFDNVTEDGARFRIYRSGGFEVRACSEPPWGASCAGAGSDEVALADVGAVFALAGSEGSFSAPSLSPSGPALSDSDLLVRVTEFIEACSGGGVLGYHVYIMLETEQGDIIVTEKLADGSVSWVENPLDLMARNSQAKVIRSADCSAAFRTVLDMRRLRFMESSLAAGQQGASASQRKLYAWTAFGRALGKIHFAPRSGFRKMESQDSNANHSTEGGRWRRKLLRRKAACQQES